MRNVHAKTMNWARRFVVIVRDIIYFFAKNLNKDIIRNIRTKY